MKRIAIFSFYDQEGVVDAYIEYILSELKTVATRVIIVINGHVDENGYNKFQLYSKDVIIRKIRALM